jgi:hypothetical protein
MLIIISNAAFFHPVFQNHFFQVISADKAIPQCVMVILKSGDDSNNGYVYLQFQFYFPLSNSGYLQSWQGLYHLIHQL